MPDNYGFSLLFLSRYTHPTFLGNGSTVRYACFSGEKSCPVLLGSPPPPPSQKQQVHFIIRSYTGWCREAGLLIMAFLVTFSPGKVSRFSLPEP